MDDWKRAQADRRVKQAFLTSLVADKAWQLSEADLDGILEELCFSDSMSLRGNLLLKLPSGIYDYEDIGPIGQAVHGVFVEKTGRPWKRKPDTSWRPPFAPATVGTMRAGDPLRAVPVPPRPATDLGHGEQATEVPLLDLFGLFCGRTTREEVIELTIADVRRLAGQARTAGRGEEFIRFLVWWHVVRCMIAVAGGGIARAINRFGPLLRILG